MRCSRRNQCGNECPFVYTGRHRAPRDPILAACWDAFPVSIAGGIVDAPPRGFIGCHGHGILRYSFIIDHRPVGLVLHCRVWLFVYWCRYKEVWTLENDVIPCCGSTPAQLEMTSLPIVPLVPSRGEC